MSTGAGVSPRTEQALREAMDRLLTGKPQCTDGRLTKNNLCKEAGVSPATMFRATTVLADWDAHIEAHGRLTPGEARRETDIHELRRELAASKREVSELQHQLVAAATVIASLHHDNQMLRAEHNAAGTLSALPLQGPTQ
ncbi:hypothetical protein [Streptomyces sp. NPDC002587]